MTSSARLAEAVLDLVLQVLGHLGRAAAQRQVALQVGVVGIAGGQVADRGLALHLQVVLVVVHLEDGLRGVHHPPDHDGRDLDGVAVGVVDLQPGVLEVADAQGHPPLRVEGVGPAQALVARGAAVGPEELQHDPLVRVHGEHPADEQDVEGEQQAEAHHPQARPVPGRLDDPEDRPSQQHEEHQQHQQPGRRRPFTLADHVPPPDVKMISYCKHRSSPPASC